MTMNRRRLFGSFLALTLASAVGFTGSAETPTPSASDTTGGAGEGSTSERFEGYVWVDVDGQPLPFQSDAAIEEYLLEAEIESSQKIPSGITAPRRVVLDRDGVRAHAAFKHVEESKKNVTDTVAGTTRLYREWRDSHVYDIAAYLLDRILGLDRVPPTVLRKIGRNGGALVMWLEGCETQTYLRDNNIRPSNPVRWGQQMQVIYIFDNLVANRDRNLGNLLFDQHWRAWSIDCSRCFGTSKELLYPNALSHCERNLWQALQTLDENQLEELLGDYLTIFEIRALLARRDQIVEQIQDKIDDLGEIHVLYDFQEPSERAPWAAD